MNPQDAAYSLSKQLPSIDYIHTGYGKLELTPEMKAAVQKALTPILFKMTDSTFSKNADSLKDACLLDIIDHPVSPDPNSVNGPVFCKSCEKQFSPFEIATDCLFPVDHPDRGLCSDCYEKELQARGES